MPRALRIGIDVGGTNTDSVLLDTTTSATSTASVLAWNKKTTTPDITSGIQQATAELLKTASVNIDEIICVTLGTTHLINALVERDPRKLRRVGVIRLTSHGFTRKVPPFIEFPAALRNVIYGGHHFIDGGIQIDGTEIGTVSHAQVQEVCKQIKESGIGDIVVCGIHSPIDSIFHQERKCKEILLQELESVNVVCSADIGEIGILERENAAILNATIQQYAAVVFNQIQQGLQAIGLKDCPILISSNDGSMLPIAEAKLTPIKSIASGPANSMLGASHLAAYKSNNKGSSSKDESKESMIVLDVGGTTTDAGVLMATGYPRQASAYSKIAQVQINAPMPDVTSVGLGGGSIVKTTPGGIVTSIGPESVGNRLTTEALCFGGSVLTATDIAVAAGLALGVGTMPVMLDPVTISSGRALLASKFEDIITSVKTQAGSLPTALVGGGTIICPRELDGETNIVRSPFVSVANAVGAATAKISASVDTIYNTDSAASRVERDRLDEITREAATEKCVRQGARPETVHTVERRVSEMAYISGKLRVMVRVVGEIGSRFEHETLSSGSSGTSDHPASFLDTKTSENGQSLPKHVMHLYNDQAERLIAGQNLLNYHPQVKNKVWNLTEVDIDWLSIGCYILGCGGGGSPHLASIEAKQLLREGKTLSIIDAQDLPSSALLPPIGKLGSPMVSVERPGGNLRSDALDIMRAHLGLDDFEATLCVEVGGSNGLTPLLAGSEEHPARPMVDGDLMGRAYPTWEMITPALYNNDVNSLLPVSLASGTGTDMLLQKAQDTLAVDSVLRACCVTMGCSAGVVSRPLTAEEFLDQGLLNTHSLSWRIGRAVTLAQRGFGEGTAADAITGQCGGAESAAIIFEGKIIDVSNILFKGHSIGQLLIEGHSSKSLEPEMEDSLGATSSAHLRISFKNENLNAEVTKGPWSGKVLATVPDLIAVLDARSGLAIGVPEYRFGLRVTIIAITASPKWTSKRGLALGGPSKFQLDTKYSPIGVHRLPQSVIREYAS